MTQPRRPISFIATNNPESTKTFYGRVLGLKLLEHSPYALVFLDGENMLRVQIIADFAPLAHTVHGWQVTDIKADIDNLVSKGVSFLTLGQMDQDGDGIWISPDGHKIVWFKDPSGNILSLTEFHIA
ncbi:MAG: VOC family protein [Sulfitobacter sp.]